MTREEAIGVLKDWDGYFIGHNSDEVTATLDMAIKALEQEPFINKSCVSEKVCEHDKQMVLDKIRAEIEEPLKINQGLNTDSAKAQTIALSWVLEVIDKYKAESENP